MSPGEVVVQKTEPQIYRMPGKQVPGAGAALPGNSGCTNEVTIFMVYAVQFRISISPFDGILDPTSL